MKAFLEKTVAFEGTDHGYLVFSVTPAEDDSLHFEAK